LVVDSVPSEPTLKTACVKLETLLALKLGEAGLLPL
jgi:hypothetical protein